MPNVGLFVGATPSLSSRAKGADPCNPGRFHSSQSSRVRDADADETARRSKTRSGGSDRWAPSKKRTPVDAIAVEAMEGAYGRIRLGRNC